MVDGRGYRTPEFFVGSLRHKQAWADPGTDVTVSHIFEVPAFNASRTVRSLNGRHAIPRRLQYGVEVLAVSMTLTISSKVIYNMFTK